MVTAKNRKKSVLNQQVKAKADLVLYQVLLPGERASRLDSMLQITHQSESGSLAPSLEALESLQSSASAYLWGAVCARFTAATGLTGAHLSAAVKAKPDHDLYICHPTPELEGAYANLWMQANTIHPQLLEAAGLFFEANGWDAAALYEIQPSQVFSGSQYLIGNERFWSTYLPFARNAERQARRKIPKAAQKWMTAALKDPRDPAHPVNYWSLIIERLLPMYLKGPGSTLKSLRLAPPTGEKRLNADLRRLREMKDIAHRTKSVWLASCWMHYRNSYFLNVIDRAWCKKHLPALTRESIQFY